MTDDPTPPTRRASEWRERGGRIVDPRTPDSPVASGRPTPPSLEAERQAALAAGVPMPPSGDDGFGMPSDPAPPTDEGTTQRPGGWVEGIGWVALLCDLAPGDTWAPHLPPAQPRHIVGERWDGTIGDSVPFSPSVVIVTRWADGTVPAPPAASRTPQADAPDPSWPTCTNCECPIQPGETHRAARRWNEELPGSCYIDDLPALASRTPEPGDGLTDIRSMYEWKALLDAQNDATSGDYRVWSRNLALRASTLIRVVAAADADALAARSTPLPTETCDPNVNPWDCTACKHTEDHPPAPLPTEQADGERWIGGGDQCPDGYEVRGINGSWYDAIDWNNDTYNDGEVIDWVRFPLRRTPDLTPADPEIAAEG